MHLVCANCNYHLKDTKTVECPRCGFDLEALPEMTVERRLQSSRKQNMLPRREAKRVRRRARKEVEAF